MSKKLQREPIVLAQLPDELRDFIVRPKIVVTRQSGVAILKQTTSGKATQALRDLMRNGD
jgi:hypothetical protein